MRTRFLQQAQTIRCIVRGRRQGLTRAPSEASVEDLLDALSMSLDVLAGEAWREAYQLLNSESAMEGVAGRRMEILKVADSVVKQLDEIVSMLEDNGV